MPYNCRMCGGTYCSEHRLPENHDCPGLQGWDDPDGVFGSGFDDSVRDQGGSSRGVLERVGVDSGPGGPLGYFRGNMTYVFLGLIWATFAAEMVVLYGLQDPRLFSNLFLLSSENVTYLWTWVTSVFAHSPYGFFHIFVNSLVLYFFGPVVEQRVGSKKFTALFLVAGAIAGLAQVGAALFLGETSAVLGASGAIAAILGVLTVLNPNLRIYLYFIIPMPLWIATLLFAGYSVLASGVGGIGAGGTAQLAHLAGLGLGLVYGLKLKRDGERAPNQLQFGGGGGPGGPGRRGRF